MTTKGLQAIEWMLDRHIPTIILALGILFFILGMIYKKIITTKFR